VHLTPKGEEIVAKLARLHRDELLNLQGIFQVPGIKDLVGDGTTNKTSSENPA
jgi:hypothetical protein